MLTYTSIASVTELLQGVGWFFFNTKLSILNELLFMFSSFLQPFSINLFFDELIDLVDNPIINLNVTVRMGWK